MPSGGTGSSNRKSAPSGQGLIMAQEHIEYYKDGGIKSKGHIADGGMDGYWEWFRKNGTKMRSGHFRNGEQVGEWVTYDQQGQVYKVTNMDKR
jgi:antitoxin component YwqK of YwqJK toxin-antitoxin module